MVTGCLLYKGYLFLGPISEFRTNGYWASNVPITATPSYKFLITLAYRQRYG